MYFTPSYFCAMSVTKVKNGSRAILFLDINVQITAYICLCCQESPGKFKLKHFSKRGGFIFYLKKTKTALPSANLQCILP